METMLSGRHSVPKRRRRLFQAVGASFVLVLALSGTASGQQQVRVTGTVTSAGGAPLSGVLVRVPETDSVATTNQIGRYTITAPPRSSLRFSLIGHRPVETAIEGRTTIDVTMDRIAVLDQVVVTGYTEGQRRAEITGAVASVNLETVERQTTASVLQRLDAAVPGVTVASGGSPGSRSTVRIRGISSFQNNDPLYIVDGTPVQDTYVNFINPNDIESIQVLKDASAASRRWSALAEDCRSTVLMFTDATAPVISARRASV